MTAAEYLTFCGEITGMKKEELKPRVQELLGLVGLAEEKHRIKGFSRGMKRRLGIAQALLGRPKLLICDEPTSALDPVGRKEILDILLAVREQTTVLFSTIMSANTGVLAGTGAVVVACYVIGLLPKLSKYVPTFLMDGNSLIYGMKDAKDYRMAFILSIVTGIMSMGLSIPLMNKKKI